MALGQTWYVDPIKQETTVNLNLRTEPRVAQSTLVRTLPKGTKLVLKNYIGKRGNWEWCEVEL